MTMEIMEGSIAIAETVRLCRPQVISAYPITPRSLRTEDLMPNTSAWSLNFQRSLPVSAHRLQEAESTRPQLHRVSP